MDIRRRSLLSETLHGGGSSEEPINIDNYLTIEALEDGLTASLSTNACKYCVDGDGNWKTLSAGTATDAINAGHTLSFRGNLTPNTSNGIGRFTISKKCNLKGNCMSMLFGDNAVDNYSLSGKDYAFYGLFQNCTNIVNVSEIFLPATTLSDYCYTNMFRECGNLLSAPKLPSSAMTYNCYGAMFAYTKIQNAPELPSLILAESCYAGMFAVCTELVEPPSLNSTTLSTACYDGMFNGCTNLTTAPDLPAESLPIYCYREMFKNCTNLNSIKMLATDIPSYTSLKDWVYGVASTGTFVKHANMTSLSTGASGIPSGWTVVNGVNTDNYLTIEALEDGLTASLSTNACEYCVDGDGNWKSLATGTTTETINSGHTLSFRGNLTPTTSNGIGIFTISKKCNLKGNCMSMLFGDNAADNYSLSGKIFAFYELFYNCKNIVNVSSNFLSATTLASSCYSNMFNGCTSLITAPELPATTLATACYNYMFRDCTSLTTAPELPATTLASNCYYSMFEGCTSLTSAPALPATTLANNCYHYMFNGCTSLTTAPELPATTLATACYASMFYGCTSLITAPVLPATTLANRCYNYMFRDCTSLTTAPSLPATTLANDCYDSMFYGCTSLITAPVLPATTLANRCYGGMFIDCTSLTTAPELPATTLAEYCYASMFYGCTSLTTALALPATTLSTYCYSNMFNGCRKLNYIKMLATDISASSCLNNWVYGVASTGTFVKNPDMSSLPTGISGIPSGWTVVNDGEEPINTDNYLTIEAIENELKASLSTNACEYCVDGDGNWKSLSAGTATESINSGQTLSFRGELTPTTSDGIGIFTINKKCNLKGNCMSMLFGDEAVDNFSLSGKNYAFYELFYNCTNIVNVSSNFLPATTLAERCYSYMFYGCKALTTTPSLPATTLAYDCYYCIFNGCTSLTTAPSLPATTLVYRCYSNMFNGCTSLTAAPALPATTLAESCYHAMFNKCTSLTTAPDLPATTLANGCYYTMFNGCTSLTTVPELPATTLTYRCYGYMFYGCSKLNYIKMLATDISASDCLYSWVYGVASTGTFVKHLAMTSLPTGDNGIPSGWTVVNDGEPIINIDNYLTIEALEDGLTASLSTNACEYCVDGDGNWKTLSAGTATESINSGQTLSFRGDLSPASYKGIGTFTISKKCNLKGNCMSMLFGDEAVDNHSLSGKNYAFYELFYNCTNIINVSSNFLPATTIANYCYHYMFQNCTSLTTAPELPATTLANYCYHYMFQNCTSLTTAPELPATTLTDFCYQYMFNGCTSLTTAPELPATTLATHCYGNMFEGCTSLTTAPTLPATTLSTNCYAAMFLGCSSLTTAPVLPATTLASNCYQRMFVSCTSLNYIKMLATDISASSCLFNWVYGVASSGTFVKHVNMTSLPTGTSGIPSGWTVVNDGVEPINTDNYLTIEAIENGLTASLSTNACEYCVDGDGNWKTLSAGTATQSINSGQTLSFRGNLTPVTSNGIGTFTISKKCNLKGNCMSMLFGDEAADNFSLSGKSFAFYRLFYNCTNIVNVSSNFLPATTLASTCYSNMFYGCAALTTAPELPATTFANSCYNSMFRYCTSLTTAPELPATTLANNCYEYMFYGCTSLRTAPTVLPATTLATYCYNSMFGICTSLTTAPELPATTLATYCYNNMFGSCTSLTTAPELPATTLAKSCYYGMFRGCTALTTAPALPATTLANDCYQYMFDGCTSLTIAPTVLPATTLANYCYQHMFDGCTSLTTAPELPATTLATYCYQYMFDGCTSLTTAPELPATTLAERCYQYMFHGCTKLNYIKMLATDISATECLDWWVSGVASSGTFVKNPTMTTLPTGHSGIPSGWTVVNDGEENMILEFPISLETVKVNNDKFYRESDEKSIALLDWIEMHTEIDSWGITVIPENILSANPIYIDDVQVISIFEDPTDKNFQFNLNTSQYDYPIDRAYIVRKDETYNNKGDIIIYLND